MKTLTFQEIPPMIAAIEANDLPRARELLDGGLSPDQPMRYPIPGSSYTTTTTAIAAVIHRGSVEMVRLLIDRGGSLRPGQDGMSPFFRAISNPDPAVFALLIEAGAVFPDEEDEVRRLFGWLFRLEPDRRKVFLPLIDRLGLSLRRYGGSALRDAADCGDITVAEYLLERGVDINDHTPDPVRPYAPTAAAEAVRRGQEEMLRFLVARGADVTIADGNGDRPYILAVKRGQAELAQWLASLEPKEWHDRRQKQRMLENCHLPPAMIEYLQSGPLRLEFPEGRRTRWAELFSDQDTVMIEWEGKQYLSILKDLDRYNSLLLVWDPRERRLCCIDAEHELLRPVTGWEEFIADPGRYLNGIVKGEFERP